MPRTPAGRRAAPAEPAETTALRALADAVGIIPEYLDQTGTERRQTKDSTREALLAAMGFDVGDEAAAGRALEAFEAEERGRLLAPARVVRVGSGDAGELDVTLPEGWTGGVDWAVELRDEEGRTHADEGRAQRGRGGRLTISLPAAPGYGYHSVRLSIAGRGGAHDAEQSLIVVPGSCPSPRERLDGQRVWGVIANLYSLRSEQNWGAGDFGDLGALLEWAGDNGAAFVGVNPLHALRNRGFDVSPYSPVSRLFRNILYLDVTAIPEFEDSAEAREWMASGAFRRELMRLRGSARLHYEWVMALKRSVLDILYRVFDERHRSGDSARGRAFQSWVRAQGQALVDFAVYSALEEHFGRPAATFGPRGAREGNDEGAASWREWPDEYRDPRSAAVAEFRERHADRVDFHLWLQFELDAQLAGAARRGRDAGLPLGIYQDLAIGSSPDGFDTWANPALFVRGASVGAPPDPYAAEGQNWGLPPIDPRRLVEDRYAFWIRLVRSALRHAGALRIDHVMGLFRLFWIPEGRSGKEGAYVRYPSEDLLGILALESTRAGALVVGEDLGTVPEDVPPALERWGLLSSRVLYFERDGEGFKPARDYPVRALTTANTHDMPTLAGFWQGADIGMRREVGLIATDAEMRRARQTRSEEKRELVGLLADEGLLPDDRPPATTQDLRVAVHTFLRRTPSWLVGLSLDDLVGEEKPVNLPGVGPDKFPSWTRRLGISLQDLRGARDVRRALGRERDWLR